MTFQCDYCAEPAVVIAPGSQEIRDLFLLRRAVPTRCWCLPHAKEAGWPWLQSEKVAA